MNTSTAVLEKPAVVFPGIHHVAAYDEFGSVTLDNNWLTEHPRNYAAGAVVWRRNGREIQILAFSYQKGQTTKLKCPFETGHLGLDFVATESPRVTYQRCVDTELARTGEFSPSNPHFFFANTVAGDSGKGGKPHVQAWYCEPYRNQVLRTEKRLEGDEVIGPPTWYSIPDFIGSEDPPVHYAHRIALLAFVAVTDSVRAYCGALLDVLPTWDVRLLHQLGVLLPDVCSPRSEY